MQTVKFQFKPIKSTQALNNRASKISCPRCQSHNLNATAIKYASIQCPDCGFAETRLAMVSRSDNPTGNLIQGLVALGVIALGAYALASLLDALNE